MSIKLDKIRHVKRKPPIVKELNMDAIINALYDMQEDCSYVSYYGNDEDAFLEVFDYNTDEVSEYKMTFSILESDIERLLDDLRTYHYLEDVFNQVFLSVGAASSYGGFAVYDEDEGDYFGFDHFYSFLTSDAAERMLRYTKKDLITNFTICFQIFEAYMGIKYRYDSLQTTLDIIKDKLSGEQLVIKQIDDIYNLDPAMESASVCSKMDNLVKELPSEVWIY